VLVVVFVFGTCAIFFGHSLVTSIPVTSTYGRKRLRTSDIGPKFVVIRPKAMRCHFCHWQKRSKSAQINWAEWERSTKMDWYNAIILCCLDRPSQ